MNIKETTQYDNYLDKDKRVNDDYKATLDKYVGDEIVKTNRIPDKIKSKEEVEGVYKVIYVHFRNGDDMVDFCSRIGQQMFTYTKKVFFPKVDPSTSLFGEEENPRNIKINRKQLLGNESTTELTDIGLKKINKRVAQDNEWKKHWHDMPEYNQKDNPPFRSINLCIRREKDLQDLSERLDQEISDKSIKIWHPKLEVTKNRFLRWVDNEKNYPLKHPMYIVSKGRADSMITSRSLSRMKIPHYIVVEPQDMDAYDKALDNFNIREYVTLLEAPFSNHGDGPGRARNWAWDHSISIGADWHWVLDDNIADFYRLNNNERIRFESSTGFRVMEDFCDRYENIYIAGPQYRFFIAPNSEYPPYVANTRIYSCLLIRNDCKHRWRGRYNEDTDICLRVMKDGDVCVQFNAFLQGKMATQTVSGGNTAEFYHAENTESIKEGYNADGTINKSQMLVDMHPDVATLEWRYGRWHHFVDYTPFKINKLKLKANVKVNQGVNEYGMILDRNFQDPRFTK